MLRFCLMVFGLMMVIGFAETSSAQEAAATQIVFPASQNYSLQIPQDWFSTIQTHAGAPLSAEDASLFVADSRTTLDAWRSGTITGAVLVVSASPATRWVEESGTSEPRAILAHALRLNPEAIPASVEFSDLAGYPAATNPQVGYRAAPFAAMTALLADDQLLHIIYAAPDAAGMQMLEAVVASLSFERTGNTTAGEVPVVGQPAADFSLALLDGRSFQLSDYIGRSVVLNFWATWCEPCHRELPLLSEAFRARTDVAVLAVNFREVPGIIHQFVELYDLGVSIGLDRAGLVSDRYAIQTLPATFVIDCTGVIQTIPQFEETTDIEDVLTWISPCDSEPLPQP